LAHRFGRLGDNHRTALGQMPEAKPGPLGFPWHIEKPVQIAGSGLSHGFGAWFSTANR
jgi:hypothetical protein